MMILSTQIHPGVIILSIILSIILMMMSVHASEISTSSSPIMMDSIQMATPLPTTTINSFLSSQSSFSSQQQLLDSIPSSLYTLYIYNASSSSITSFYSIQVNPISIGDAKNIACLSCTSQANIVYLVINSMGVSFQYEAKSSNNCPLEILRNFNPNNYTDSDGFHLPKIPYSPQYTVSNLMNVTTTTSSSSSQPQYTTLYGYLYRHNSLVHDGAVCMIIESDNSSSSSSNGGGGGGGDVTSQVKTIYLNMAKNGPCPKVSSSGANVNSCKLSSDTKYVVEQTLVIRKK
nr:unnamed protein product [Naegleria fowleri]